MGDDECQGSMNVGSQKSKTAWLCAYNVNDCVPVKKANTFTVPERDRQHEQAGTR